MVTAVVGVIVSIVAYGDRTRPQLLLTKRRVTFASGPSAADQSWPRSGSPSGASPSTPSTSPWCRYQANPSRCVDLEPGFHRATFRSIALAREFVFDPGTF
jgi:hypothetical protein